MPMKYLGRVIVDSRLDRGVVMFESDTLVESLRLLLILFDSGPIEAIPERLKEHGLRLTTERLELHPCRLRLPGHDKHTGWAYRLVDAKRALVEKELAVA